MANTNTPPRRGPVPIDQCGIARALENVPDRWTWLILRELMYGVGRFADIQAEIGIPKSVLSARLRKIVEDGLAEKHPYRDGTARTRHAYVLTRKGRMMVPVLIALMHWGDALLSDQDSVVSLVDRRTGKPVRMGITFEENILPARRLKLEVPAIAAE